MILYIVVKLIGLLQGKRRNKDSASKRRIRWCNFILLQCFQRWGCAQTFSRIRRHYAGITIKRIQKWLNSNEDHFKANPIFSNKPPLTLVVSKSVQGCNQIDLVDMRSMAVSTNGTQYNYVLSVLDVFSRYLWLRPLSGKNSAEVLKHLKEIFR